MGMESPRSQTVPRRTDPPPMDARGGSRLEPSSRPTRRSSPAAGPAGLTAAYELTKHGQPCVVLEADPRMVGGISRTDQYKGYRFDIGGHRFFSKSSEINALWREILGDEFITRDRG